MIWKVQDRYWAGVIKSGCHFSVPLFLSWFLCKQTSLLFRRMACNNGQIWVFLFWGEKKNGAGWDIRYKFRIDYGAKKKEREEKLGKSRKYSLQERKECSIEAVVADFNSYHHN